MTLGHILEPVAGQRVLNNSQLKQTDGKALISRYLQVRQEAGPRRRAQELSWPYRVTSTLYQKDSKNMGGEMPQHIPFPKYRMTAVCVAK